MMRYSSLLVCAGVLVTTPAMPQNADALTVELASINQQIDEVEARIGQLGDGLISSLAQARREALMLSRTVVENRMRAENGEATIEILVPSTAPDEALANRLLGEMALAQQRVDAAEQEAQQGGGLIQALAMSRVETEKLTLAQLQMGFLQAKYGIGFPSIAEQATFGAVTANNGNQEPTNQVALTTDRVAWADPRFPDIDYSSAIFEQAHNDGNRISGWWGIKSENAAIDDSLQITALNYSAYDPENYMGFTGLVARCIEGETAFIFIQDDYLISDFRRNTFDMTIRIDDEPAIQTRWGGLTSNQGAGLFGRDAETFIRQILEAKQLFIRLVENNGQAHDAVFQLAGGIDAYDEVASACGWSTLALTIDDYRAIQTLLSAGGFYSLAPDGQWGPASQEAMRAYQRSVGLAESGAADRATLQQLGLREQ